MCAVIGIRRRLTDAPIQSRRRQGVATPASGSLAAHLASPAIGATFSARPPSRRCARYMDALFRLRAPAPPPRGRQCRAADFPVDRGVWSRGERDGLFEDLERIVTNVILFHLVAKEFLGNDILLDALA